MHGNDGGSVYLIDNASDKKTELTNDNCNSLL